MDLHIIEDKISEYSPFVKEVVVCIHDGSPFAIMHPDFQALKKANIINIEEELRWYAVELYNMEVSEEEKVRGYMISKEPLPKTESQELDISAINELINNGKITKSEDDVIEPDDEVYRTLKSYISNFSESKISPLSHLELDLGLDSLDYVELFAFIDESFGVYVDEIIFSHIMKMQDLYEYVKEHKKYLTPTDIKWKNILDEKTDEKLTYSPYIMMAYQIILYPLFKLYFRLGVKGKENIPSTPCIFAPSHQSMLDGFIIEASLPYSVIKRTFFLAFELVFGTSLMRPVAHYGQSILIDANNHLKLSMQRTAQPLKEGNNVVIFPEGARTRDGKLLEFRPFFAMLSKVYNLPVVPIVVDGSFEALPTGKIFPRPKKVKLTFLEPIYPDGLSTNEITRRTKEAIAHEMKANPIIR